MQAVRAANSHLVHVAARIEAADGASIERKRVPSNQKDLKRKLRTFHNDSTDMGEEHKTPSLAKLNQ